MSSSDEITSETELASLSESDLNTTASNSVPEKRQDNVNVIPISQPTLESPTKDQHGLFYIKENSECTVCQSIVLPEDALPCFICEDVFHATCRDTKGVRDNAICVPSFLKTFGPLSKKYGVNKVRTGNFCFICDICISTKVACKQNICNSSVSTGHSVLNYTNKVETIPITETDSNTKSDISVSAELNADNLLHNVSDQISTMKNEILNELGIALDNKLEGIIAKLSTVHTIGSNSADQLSPRSYADSVCVPHPPPPSLISTLVPDTTISSSNSESTMSHDNTTESTQPIPSSAPQTTEAIILSPQNEGYKTLENMNKVKKEVEKILKDTQVEFVRTKPNSMNIIVGFKNADLRNTSIAAIESTAVLNDSGYLARCSNKMLPKISLFNIPEEVLDDVDRTGNTSQVRASKKQAIVDKILAKNPGVARLKNMGHTLEVVYINCNDETKLMTVGLKVSPAIRCIIDEQQQGNVYLGNGRYRYKDRFYIKHCFHCQMIGHVSNDCPDKDKASVCMYCMGRHRSSNCSLKSDDSQFHCARCIASPHSTEAENGNNHYAGDRKCPSMLREIERLKSNTEFQSKNVM